MLKKADKSGLSFQVTEELRRLVSQDIDAFQTSLSSGSPGKAEQLRIRVTDEAKPVRICIWNYSLEQRVFFSCFVSQLATARVA